MVKLPLVAVGGGVGEAGLAGVAGRVAGLAVGGGACRVERGCASAVRRLGLSGTGSSSQSSHRVRLRDGMGAELVLPISKYSEAMSRKKRLMTQLLV